MLIKKDTCIKGAAINLEICPNLIYSKNFLPVSQRFPDLLQLFGASVMFSVLYNCSSAWDMIFLEKRTKHWKTDSNKDQKERIKVKLCARSPF